MQNARRARYHQKKKRAEAAVMWMISTPGATYSKASSRFEIPVNSIRCRVEYRYGSLAMAREEFGLGLVSKRRNRKCLVCREEQEMDSGQYICPKCRSENDKLHDGGV